MNSIKFISFSFFKSHTQNIRIVLGKHKVDGVLQCYKCTAEDENKCHFARSDEGGEEDDDTWFGEKVNCTATDTHCMTARTRKKKYVQSY